MLVVGLIILALIVLVTLDEILDIILRFIDDSR
jgi:hypothetical protein